MNNKSNHLEEIKYPMEALRAELQLIATSIVGHTVLLFVQPPIVDDAAGQAYRNSNGVMCIDVHPEFANDDLSFYWVWLHEVGHLYLGHVPEDRKRIPEIERMHMNGDYLKRSEKTKAEYIDDPDEKQADSFREQVDRIAKDRANASFGNDEIKTRLFVLKNTIFMK